MTKQKSGTFRKTFSVRDNLGRLTALYEAPSDAKPKDECRVTYYHYADICSVFSATREEPAQWKNEYDF